MPKAKRAVPLIATPIDTTAMLNAVYAPLTGGPSSEQGRLVVTRLCAAIEEYERAHKPRKYARRGTSAQFEKAVGAFVADLLFAQDHPSAQGWVYRSLRPQSFDNSGLVTRTQADAVVTGLPALGMMQHVPGYARFNDFGGKTHVAPKLLATAALLELCTQCGVEVAHAKEHFVRGGPTALVVVRAATEGKRNGAKKSKGAMLKIEIPHQLSEEMEELNSFLDGVTLEGGTCSGLYRVFHNGDAPDFAFRSGGRLQAAGENSYQNLPSAERLQMRINGEHVAEVDVQASHLTILHALHKENFTGDPYVVPSVGVDGRTAVKGFIAAALGAGQPPTKWPVPQSKKFLGQTGEKLQKRWPIEKISEAVLTQHPVLSKLSTPIDGSIGGWAFLTWIESQAILKTMLDLKRVYAIPSYPVHDSLIVPLSMAERTNKQFRAHYLGELLALYKDPTPPTLRITSGQF
jgi:hypothetical protein